MNEIKVSGKDLIFWALNQDPERKVNMLAARVFGDGCGCLMVQYAKDVLGFKDPSCGSYTIVDVTSGDRAWITNGIMIQQLVPEDFWPTAKNFHDIHQAIELTSSKWYEEWEESKLTDKVAEVSENG